MENILKDVIERIHALTNILQAVLSFVELDDKENALKQVRLASDEIKKIYTVLRSTVRVAVNNTKTVTVEVPPNAVIVIPTKETADALREAREDIAEKSKQPVPPTRRKELYENET